MVRQAHHEWTGLTMNGPPFILRKAEGPPFILRKAEGPPFTLSAVEGWALRSLSSCLLLFLACAAPQTPTQRARQLVEDAKSEQADVLLLCEPSKAEVLVDDVLQGLCEDFDGKPKGLRLGSGLKRIEIRHPGFHSHQTSYEASGVRASFRIALVPLTAPR